LGLILFTSGLYGEMHPDFDQGYIGRRIQRLLPT